MGGDPFLQEGDPPGGDPPVNRITDACENITLPQLHCGGNKFKGRSITCWQIDIDIFGLVGFIFSIFKQFLLKSGGIMDWRSPLRLAPPLGNPGSKQRLYI